MKQPRPMPVIMLDTNAFNNFAFIDHNLAQRGLPHPTIYSLLDNIIAKGKATLIIPRSVFNESTGWIIRDNEKAATHATKGYLDLVANPHGQPALPSGDLLTYPGPVRFLSWLRDKQSKGQLRVHTGLEACYDEARELTRAKGGLVILEPYAPPSPPFSKTGVIPTREVTYNPHMREETSSKLLLPEADIATGKGDGDLAFIARTIAKYAQTNGIPANFLFVTDDKECREVTQVRGATYSESESARPITLNNGQFLSVLEKQGLMHPKHRAACLAHSGQALQQYRSKPHFLETHPIIARAGNWFSAQGVGQGHNRSH